MKVCQRFNFLKSENDFALEYRTQIFNIIIVNCARLFFIAKQYFFLTRLYHSLEYLVCKRMIVGNIFFPLKEASGIMIWQKVESIDRSPFKDEISFKTYSWIFQSPRAWEHLKVSALACTGVGNSSPYCRDRQNSSCTYGSRNVKHILIFCLKYQLGNRSGLPVPMAQSILLS